MYVFANASGQAVVVTGAVSRRMPFSFPEMDTALTSLVSSIRVSPKPIISVVSSLGGHNYISVFGEDPMHIEISGIVVGSSCGTTRRVSSAIANTVSFYQQNGVINRVTPVTFNLGTTGSDVSKGFVVALTVQQSSDNLDLASFSMLLLTDSLDNRELVVSDPPPLVNDTADTASSRGLSSNLLASSTGAIPSQDWSSVLIDSNGEVLTRITQTIQA